MNIVIIGLGSMGKRRARLIKELFPEYTITGIDGREDRRLEASELFGIDTYSAISDVNEKQDCAFVCTSPLSHSSIITECLNHKWHVFTELNLVDDGYSKNLALAQKNGCILFLSSTFLYREETKYIRSRITKDTKWNYIYHIGQYLPDWHPWENYNDFFIGDNRTNGCREILAIELPWLINSFGDIIGSHTVSDKITSLNIGFHDNYMIQLTHEYGNKGVLIVDVVTPCAKRSFEAYSENRYISWNGTPESLFEYNTETGSPEHVSLTEQAEHMEGYNAFVVENAYKNEIREFFGMINDGKPGIYSFEQDRRVLQLIDSFGA